MMALHALIYDDRGFVSRILKFKAKKLYHRSDLWSKTDTIFLCGVGFHKKTAQNPTPVVLKGRLIQFISGRSIIDRLRLFERTGDRRRFCKKQVLAAMLRSVENRRDG